MDMCMQGEMDGLITYLLEMASKQPFSSQSSKVSASGEMPRLNFLSDMSAI